jgi:hypothetical protein
MFLHLKISLQTHYVPLIQQNALTLVKTINLKLLICFHCFSILQICQSTVVRFGAVKDAIEFGDYTSVHSELATCGVDTTDEWCDNRKGGGSGEEGEEEDKCEPEAVPSFAEAHAALVKVKLFFYAHNIIERDEEDILNKERALFGLKRKVLTKQLSIKDFFGKKE